MKKRKLLICFSVILALFILLASTNPSEKDFCGFSEEKLGEAPIPPDSLIFQQERINFLLFSTYTPVIAHEHGITQLAIMGNFIQISNGQFDYPGWLVLFGGWEYKFSCS